MTSTTVTGVGRVYTIGIVGFGQDKTTPEREAKARELIRTIMGYNLKATYRSGRSPKGGIDSYVEEEGTKLGVTLDIKVPTTFRWSKPGENIYGFKERNMDIAKSNTVVVIVAQSYPPDYVFRSWEKGWKDNPECYHCSNKSNPDVPQHVKSGGCWTGRKAIELGNSAIWYVI